MKITVSKVEAAERQLSSAIGLYFLDGDPVAIHTLAAAAHQLLDDVSKSRGLPKTQLHQAFEDRIVDEHLKEVITLIRKPANFFKHADKGTHDQSIEYDPDQSIFWLLGSVYHYQAITGQQTKAGEMYSLWLLAKNPKWMKPPAGGPDRIQQTIEAVRTMSKAEFRDAVARGTIKL